MWLFGPKAQRLHEVGGLSRASRVGQAAAEAKKVADRLAKEAAAASEGLGNGLFVEPQSDFSTFLPVFSIFFLFL